MYIKKVLRFQFNEYLTRFLGLRDNIDIDPSLIHWAWTGDAAGSSSWFPQPGGGLIFLVHRPAHGLHTNGAQQSLSSEHYGKLHPMISHSHAYEKSRSTCREKFRKIIGRRTGIPRFVNKCTTSLSLNCVPYSRLKMYLYSLSLSFCLSFSLDRLQFK